MDTRIEVRKTHEPDRGQEAEARAGEDAERGKYAQSVDHDSGAPLRCIM